MATIHLGSVDDGSSQPKRDKRVTTRSHGLTEYLHRDWLRSRAFAGTHSDSPVPDPIQAPAAGSVWWRDHGVRARPRRTFHMVAYYEYVLSRAVPSRSIGKNDANSERLLPRQAPAQAIFDEISLRDQQSRTRTRPYQRIIATKGGKSARRAPRDEGQARGISRYNIYKESLR